MNADLFKCVDKDLNLQKERNAALKHLRKSRDHHARILKHGTTDPFWPDGVNANLVRNHILYYRANIASVCKTLGEKIPKEARAAAPKRVSSQYMAPGSKAAKHYAFHEVA